MVMDTLSDRVECKELLNRLISPEDAARFVTDRSILAISGFTKSGEPKRFLPALAAHLAELIDPDGEATHPDPAVSSRAWPSRSPSRS